MRSSFVQYIYTCIYIICTRLKKLCERPVFSQDGARAPWRSMFVLFLLQDRIEHRVPLRLQAGVELGCSARSFDDLEV